jgi:elongation factor Tu
VDEYIPTPVREVDKPFLMPIEDVFGIKGRGTVVTGRVERGIGEGGDEVEIMWAAGDAADGGDRGGDVPQDVGRRDCWGQHGHLLRGIERDEVERGQVLAKPGSITPHTEVHERGVRVEEGGGGAAHAVLQWVSAAVLHSDDGCDGEVSCPRGGDGDAGDNVNLKVKLIVPVALEVGVAVCHPRGRPHRGRRRHHPDRVARNPR